MKQPSRKELKEIIKRAMAENEDWEDRYKQVSRGKWINTGVEILYN
jgi:sulfur transfer protein SufE